MSKQRRAECRYRSEVALANVGAAQASTLAMRKAPAAVVGLLDQAQSALRQAIAELDKLESEGA